ncbi:hypothetical protein SEA_SUPERSULLEY_55 [Gordonia phage SuperSulley]|nr:hypothetical protein SEA_SUPERSULLEY_55 [Gordonia phage SuperSulley]
MDIEQTLKSLDFQPEGVPCDVHRTRWNVVGETLPAGIPERETHRGGCQNLSRKLVTIRLCPCWSDPRKIPDIEGYVFDNGLLVSRLMLCEPHLEYFRHYLNYPFLCPGCGVHFNDADAILLNVQQT